MRLHLLGSAAGILVLGACGNSVGPPQRSSCTPTSTTVCMMGVTFTPSHLNIAAGVTVTWQNPSGSSLTHTVTWLPTSTEIFNSGDPPSGVAPGDSFSHTFRTPGTYYYYCQYYGDSTAPAHGMVGIITVH